MARAAAKKKRDIPPLYMLIADGGRLDPAFQHDQERLMSFRRGTRLVVTVEPDGSRRGVRKWHAIIGKAVKNSLLPWVTVSAADEAIRLALDLYEPKKANDGSWHRITQSLNDLTDEELDEQIERMTALIVKYSGVDPDDFKREMHGAGDERFASEYDKPAADNDAGSAASIASPLDAATNLPDEPSQAPSGDIPADVEPPVSVGGEPNSDEATNPAITLEAETDSAGDPASKSAAGAPNSAEVTAPETGASPTSSGADTQPVGTAAPELSEADRAWLKLGAHWMLAALPADDPEALRVLLVQVAEIRKVMPKDVSRDALQRMETMRLHCRDVCDGKDKLDKRFMATTALATPAEIEPKPIKTSRAAT